MRLRGTIAGASALLAACGAGADGPSPAPSNQSQPESAGDGAAPVATAKPPPAASAARWDLQSSGEGVALAMLEQSGRASIRLFCPARQNLLLVNVPDFRPIGSEDRLSFGNGGEAHALVADSRGDRERGGVSATGEVPDSLEALVAGPVSASYGRQRSGPHPEPPQALADAFVGACREGAAGRDVAERPTASASPCLVQDGKRLPTIRLRAVGTEPFWSARVEGRCVTYSHPEDQKGARVWTRFTPGPEGGGIWAGSLGGRRFELRTRGRAGCSDGMSDRRYPLAAELVVAGELRGGCAEPLPAPR